MATGPPQMAAPADGPAIECGCTLRHEVSSLVGRLLRRLFRRATFLDTQRQQLAALESRGVLVYASKYRSQLDFLFVHSRLADAGLRPPCTVFDLRVLLWLPAWEACKLLIGFVRYYLREGRLPDPYETNYYRRVLQQHQPTMCFLVGKAGYYRRFGLAEHDPLFLLIQTQRELEVPVYIVPTLVFHGKAPMRTHRTLVDIFFGDKERPGRLRKLVAFLRNYNRNVLEMAEPLDLEKWLASQPESAGDAQELSFRLRRELTERIDRHRRVVLGPIMKSRLEIKEIVLHNKNLQKHMQRRARANNRTLADVRREADGYLNEIATDYNMTYVYIWDRILTWVWNTIFDGIDLDVESLNRVKHAAQQAPVVYVPSHKSHIDYLILSYLLYQHNLNAPFIAAGRNLAFWPMGPIFRKSGAFFIRRSFRGQRFYAEVFATYIKTLVQEGYNIEFFIEGGRSRTGKLVLPKLGLLAILIQAVEEGYCNDLIFVPTAINYDRIIEEGAYLNEIKGGSKQAENLGQLVRARRVLKKRYGKVYVRFAPPISLKEYMQRRNLDFASMRPKERHAMYRDFGWRIIHSINSASLVTPFALVAAAFLTTPKKGISQTEVDLIIKFYYDYLVHTRVRLADTLRDLDKTVQETIGLMEKSKWLEVLADEDETEDEGRIYTIEDGSRLQLEYYKNNIIHFLLAPAYVSTAILAQESFEIDPSGLGEDLQFFRDLFKFEFVYDADEDLNDTVNQVLSYFRRQGFIVGGNGAPTFRISHVGLKALSSFAGLLKSYLESYRIVLRGTKYLDKKPYGEKDFLKKLNSLATRLSKLGVVERAESNSRITFENAIKYYCERGIILKQEQRDNGKATVTFQPGENREGALTYARMIDRYLRTSHFTFQ